jgi:hypothetical protein
LAVACAVCDAVDVPSCVSTVRLAASGAAAGLDPACRGAGSVEAAAASAASWPTPVRIADRDVLWLALRQAGLTRRLPGLIDGVGRVDFVVDGWLVVEADGSTYHSTRRATATTGATNALTLLGYTVLRFSYEDVMFRLADVRAHRRGRPRRRPLTPRHIGAHGARRASGRLTWRIGTVCAAIALCGSASSSSEPGAER